MPGAVGLAVILLWLGVLVFLHGEGTIAGLAPDQLARLVALTAFGLLAASWMFERFRGGWAAALRDLVLWAAILIGLVALYTYRFEVQDVASRMLGEVVPGQAVVTRGGEVTFSRRRDGSFLVGGRANGRDLRFIFDTGASVVVLTGESAAALGLDPARLDYSVPVATANGRTMAAPLTLESLSVGSITERRVRALVARPGALQENLLGMSFLERLASYEVRDGRLFLRGRGA